MNSAAGSPRVMASEASTPLPLALPASVTLPTSVTTSTLATSVTPPPSAAPAAVIGGIGLKFKVRHGGLVVEQVSLSYADVC